MPNLLGGFEQRKLQTRGKNAACLGKLWARMNTLCVVCGFYFLRKCDGKRNSKFVGLRVSVIYFHTDIGVTETLL